MLSCELVKMEEVGRMKEVGAVDCSPQRNDPRTETEEQVAPGGQGTGRGDSRCCQHQWFMLCSLWDVSAVSSSVIHLRSLNGLSLLGNQHVTRSVETTQDGRPVSGPRFLLRL